MQIHKGSIEDQSRPAAHWLTRMGVAGFLFFLLKGMLWILIPWLAHSAVF